MTQHSNVIGGSTAAQRINCPGSYKYEQIAGPGEESEYAARGTALHQAVEPYVGLDPEAAEKELGKVHYGFEMTRELVDFKLKPALEAWLELDEAVGGVDTFRTEARVSMDSAVPGAFGTTDVIARTRDGRVIVHDWKFGDGVPVKAEGNFQAAFYGACALLTPDEEVQRIVGDADTFILSIAQPIVESDAPVLDYWQTNRQWLEWFIELCVDSREKALQDDPPLKTGPHCRWCSAKAFCPEQRARATEFAKAPEIQAMTPLDVAIWMRKADEHEEWIKALRSYAHRELERGVTVPGFKLVNKRASRQWIDEDAAAGAIARELGVGGVHERKVLSPPKVEKIVGKDRYAEAFDKHVTMVSSGTTLAPDTDRRPDASGGLRSLGRKLSGLQKLQQQQKEEKT